MDFLLQMNYVFWFSLKAWITGNLWVSCQKSYIDCIKVLEFVLRDLLLCYIFTNLVNIYENLKKTVHIYFPSKDTKNKRKLSINFAESWSYSMFDLNCKLQNLRNQMKHIPA